VASGEWRVASGEWRVASGEWRVASGEWRENSGQWHENSGQWMRRDGTGGDRKAPYWKTSVINETGRWEHRVGRASRNSWMAAWKCRKVGWQQPSEAQRFATLKAAW